MSIYNQGGVILMDPMKTGLFIQTLRKERKLTQQELADLLLVTNKAISRWETGEGFPDVVILPRLSEVLGVTVDEILAGAYLKRTETKILTEVHKLKNTLLMTKVIMILSFVLFLGLTYSTYKVWIGFLGYVLPSTLGLTWLLITRNNYMEACVYDEDDRLILFKTIKESITIYITLLMMTLPQLIMVGTMGQWNNGVLVMESYVVSAVFLGLFMYLGVSFYFYRFFEEGKYKKLEPHNLKKILAYTFLLFVFVLGFYWISGEEEIMNAAALFVVLISIMHLMLMMSLMVKKIASLKHTLSLLGFSFVLLFFIIGDIDSFPIELFIAVYIMLTLTFLIVSIHKIKQKKRNAWFYVFYQNLWLYLFVLMYTSGAFIVFILMYMAYFLMDMFVISRIEMTYINQNQALDVNA